MMGVFITILCSLLAVCSVSARDSRHEGTDGQAAIYRLSPFERAVRCTKYFEGWHSEKHHPYVGYGHKLLPGERYSARTMTKRQADALLRKDLRKFCAMFRWRQKHLSGVYRLLQLQGETARHAAQTEKGGVCAALYSVIKHVPCIFIQGTCIHSFLIWLFA